MTKQHAEATKVVTWSTPRGDTIDICRECEARMAAKGTWPGHRDGGEYCHVSRGLHYGICQTCQAAR